MIEPAGSAFDIAHLPHPEHQKFGGLLGKLGIVEDVFVVDDHPRGSRVAGI